MAEEDPSRVAFLLIRAPNDDGKHRYLLQKRADDANNGGTWGLPGGKTHMGEDPWDAAVRESCEELGDLPDMHPAAHWRRDDDGKAIHTYLVDLLAMFAPSLDGVTPDETAGWGWFKRKHVTDLPLHPAFAETWDRIDWDEVGKSLAKAIMTPAQFQIQQLAAEAARQLASQLGASVNSGQVSQQWQRRYANRKHPQRRRSNRKPRQRPAPRRYLNTVGVTAAIAAALTAVLLSLWAAAWVAGLSAAAFLLGVGMIAGYEMALAELEAEGKRRIEGMVQTRASRLERVLMEALSQGWDADRLAEEIRNILSSDYGARIVTETEANWALNSALYWSYQQAGVEWVRWQTRNDGNVCAACKANQAASPKPLGALFPSGNRFPPAHPHERCRLMPAAPPKAAKSAETPELEATPHQLGPEGLWHTPDKHVNFRQKLPNYIEHIAAALMRDQGMGEQQAIATAINAVKRWAKGDLHWGKGHVTPEVQAASQRALREWQELKESHH